MPKVKIKAPVNSIQSAKSQISAGADEIYVGYTSDTMNKLCFTGRGKSSFYNHKTHVDFSDLEKITKVAHDNNVNVELAANMPMIGDDPDGGARIQSAYLDYVLRGKDAGIDRVIVGDIGNIILLKTVDVRIPITASVFLATINQYQVKLLEELGVEKVVLPHHLTIDEIASICKSTTLSVEVFAHLGCSFLEGTCSMYHHASEEINFGIPCRAKFKVENSGESVNILDTAEDCSLCYLGDLVKTGIEGMKIVGRELDYKFTSSITHLYAKVLELLENDDVVTPEEIKKYIFEKYNLEWWEKSFCSQNRCKYKITDFYI